MMSKAILWLILVVAFHELTSKGHPEKPMTPSYSAGKKKKKHIFIFHLGKYMSVFFLSK